MCRCAGVVVMMARPWRKRGRGIAGGGGIVGGGGIAVLRTRTRTLVSLPSLITEVFLITLSSTLSSTLSITLSSFLPPLRRRFRTTRTRRKWPSKQRVQPLKININQRVDCGDDSGADALPERHWGFGGYGSSRGVGVVFLWWKGGD